MKTRSLAFFVAASSILLSACNKESLTTSIDQDNLCEVNSWAPAETSKTCKVGQKVVFLPNSFGNEQLPILFAALNCDLRYSVALTTGAVSCIYAPTKLKPENAAK
jgi:hypothetical protein